MMNGKVSPFKTPADKKLNGRIEILPEEQKSDHKSHSNSQSSHSSDSENLTLTTFYSLKDQDIYKTSLQTKLTEKVFTIDNLYFPKIAYT